MAETVDVEAREVQKPTPAFSTPGEADESRFDLHESCGHWKTWYFEDSDYPSTPELIAAALQQVSGSVSSVRNAASPTTAAYWAFHSVKNAFFAAQGLAGITYTELQLQLRGQSDGQSAYPLPSGARARLMCETYECFKQDLNNIHEGVYKLPWDMTAANHRQYNPLFVLGKAAEFVTEANLTLSRRKAQRAEPVWMKSEMYPEYYLSTFHYQTDGWFSSKSASIYETSTETLFLGRQDAMQRHALLPLHRWLDQNGRDPATMTLLEVACGTGRFHTFIKDNYPSMSTAALDLSPYYLQAARENVRYWQRITGNSSAGPTEFMHAAAEAIPMAAGSCDVVVSVYMFHEMPRPAQEAAVKEMARVLRPGGLVVIADSIQLGDRPILDDRIGNFQQFNEPHYGDYVRADLGEMFTRAGLRPFLKALVSSTKVLSFTKPQ